jgi:hypothetical protein
MKTIALIAAIMISTNFVFELPAASAGNTSRWIQLGLSAANTARTVSKARQGDNSGYGAAANSKSLVPKSLVPKLLRRR